MSRGWRVTSKDACESQTDVCVTPKQMSCSFRGCEVAKYKIGNICSQSGMNSEQIVLRRHVNAEQSEVKFFLRFPENYRQIAVESSQ